MKGNDPKKSGKDGKQQKFKSIIKDHDDPPSHGNQKSFAKEERQLN